MLDFRLLGSLEVVGDDGPRPLAGHRQRSLLALLLLDANRVVPSERLIDAMWGESPPAAATTSLHNAVAQLRRVLEPGMLETRAPGYVLHVDPERIDAFRFERMLGKARSAEPTEKAQILGDALALWRGLPLAEFSYETWGSTAIDRLEELRLEALEERIGADLELGADAGLVGELETFVREHPLRERPIGLLMRALDRARRQADALDAYTRARRRFDELGLELPAELRRLHGEIVRGETRIRPAQAVGAEEGEIVKALLLGQVVPVLGLDGAIDLAAELAHAFEVPNDRPLDLARVSQYVAMMQGSGPLYDQLHARFEAATEPGPLHRFLARLPPLLREHGAPHQLVVSTRYDLALERAFEEAGEEVDVVTYVAAGRHRGKFWHRPPAEAPRPVDIPNTYVTELSLERRTVLLKLHGAVDPFPEREWESFVITEDDYFDYLGRYDVAAAVPVSVAARLRRSHFLFIGYEMVDWNLRLVMHRLWGDRPVAYRSWAIDPAPTPLERAFWRRFEVDIVDADPSEYVELLARRLELAPA